MTDTSLTERLAKDRDPTQQRYVSSYAARRVYTAPTQTPPEVHGVEDTIDIHCHAHEGQQDPLSVAKLASTAKMAGILFKTIRGTRGGALPTDAVDALRDPLARWADENKIAPIKMWAGFCPAGRAMSLDAVPAQVLERIKKGIVSVWMPLHMHANTLVKVGGRPIWWDKNADPKAHTPPLSWEESLQRGHYLLDGSGKLKAPIQEVFRMVADHNIAISFGHATHREIDAMAEQVSKLGIKKAFVDHPFSPFVDLDLKQMRQLTAAGIYMNFTFDEISPLLAVDPARMAATILALGTDYVTLSSDAGEPLFPNSVECMRILMGHMRAFGLSDAQVRQIAALNPAKIVGA